MQMYRRWERSLCSTVTHTPVVSAVSNIHLMPVPNAAGAAAYAVLSSSLPYGVVARSLPLNGYRFRGYLDAAGTLNGLGVGNPNADRKSTRLNSSHSGESRMPSSA